MPTLIKNGKNYSGTSVSLTQAEYDALSTTQKNDGTVYFISDSDAILDASDVSVGSGTVEDSIGSIAVIETSPATSAHAVGTYLVYNGKLYKVTSAISVSEQLVVGTNISAVTVGGELTDIINHYAQNVKVLSIATNASTTNFKINVDYSRSLALFYFDNQKRVSIITKGANSTGSMAIINGTFPGSVTFNNNNIIMNVGIYVRSVMIFTSDVIDAISVETQ